ncbi:hypothetical protein EHS25_002509 [Saitozyma podzolica]|uniref:Amino acid transporter transmembrane domain-containing protein n=1 Tax=Saitozyma podzolica TaxID=1890683 RepID=A0A427YEK5_9TREE|nr:hypothetical protein EHS25_002509 [Saitozyma podzolica]
MTTPVLDSLPLLPTQGQRLSSEAGPSRPMSRGASSRPSSRARSRRNSNEGKLRLSGDVERQSGSGRSSRAGIRAEENGHVLFKAPEDELDEHSTTAPLLAHADGELQPMSEEEREAVLDEGPNTGLKGTLMDGIANMANSIIGAGIVGLPYAVSQAGFVMGVVLLVGLAIVTDWTIRLVVLNAKLSGRDSYTDVMHHVFGNLGSASVSFFQFAFAFGGRYHPHAIGYIIPSLSKHAVLRLLVNRQVVIILCTICVSLPLSLHTDIVKLSKSSSFALISMGIIVSSVVLRAAAVDKELRGPPLAALSVVRPGVFEAIGVISFAYVCHHNTMYIYQSIHTPTLDRFAAVTHVSTSISLITCLLMAVTGYLTFTDKTQGNILNNFSADDLLINIARACLGANMSTTIPLENYVCREVIEDFFFKGKPFSRVRNIVVTSLLVFTTMGISLMTCDLGVVLELAGGLSATALAFIFPASAYAALIQGPWYAKSKLPAIICASFGCLVLLLSCGLTVSKAFRGEGGGKQCTT